MARICIKKILHIGIPDKHHATSWHACFNPNCSPDDCGDPIDESLYDNENLLQWVTLLPDKNGSYYKDKVIHVYVKVHFGPLSSVWIKISSDQRIDARRQIVKEYDKFTIPEKKEDIYTCLEKDCQLIEKPWLDNVEEE